MGLEYKPDFLLTANDQDITDIIKKSLVQLSLKDNNGEESDVLQLTLFLDSNVKTPTKGATLKLSLGFEGGLIDKGQFTVNQVAVNGPPRMVQITANATKVEGKKPMNSHKTRSFDGVTFGELIEELASDHDLKPKVAEHIGVLRLEHIDQTGESDMSLLTRLAKQNGAVVKHSNGCLLLVGEHDCKSVSGKWLPDIKITPEQVSNWQYQSASQNDAQSVTASYRDVESGENKEITMGEGEPVFRIAYPLNSKAEAVSAIKSKLESAKAGASTIAITMPANPEIMQLVAESTVTLSGFGDVEDRKWNVKNLEWSLSDMGFQFRINANLGAEEKKKPAPLPGTE